MQFYLLPTKRDHALLPVYIVPRLDLLRGRKESHKGHVCSPAMPFSHSHSESSGEMPHIQDQPHIRKHRRQYMVSVRAALKGFTHFPIRVHHSGNTTELINMPLVQKIVCAVSDYTSHNYNRKPNNTRRESF